ncbi:uncharacterized protein LACBIDRAFT_297602 [Laccaria bicolor S238N-H82]|uniref:Predicted protein n=1 Tax=Laccaria bicolor (strain S238N-H82 / ATCC MYA-4686) TaxID=486041 RepID=B0DBK5_LACBS|nr:uncharacterized protein LACBIDRAFT_297602 [Laccaria bicolor S238N-H82]EDR08199.1 predicted protein [Laccaria bicolor S238N-H82]|eukprot:XP_001881269.1 predicted protein [Laccaria bicolor S238N-H82]
MPSTSGFVLLASLFLATTAQYSATYLPSNAPPTTEEGQVGTNQCGTALNQTSMCQNAYINSLTDFCIWAPPNPGPDSVIGNTERIEVAWCLKNGTGARLIPDGAITGAHFVQTPDYVQVTGTGDLTLLNIPAGDAGGELDPHGADGNGNPIGGLVFSTAFGPIQQIFEWTNFVAANQFCFRACKPGPNAAALCEHIYDIMGCAWNMPGNYDTGFDTCKGDSGEPMGVYGASTFHQGDAVTPPAHPAPSSSSCVTTSTIGNGFHISGTSISTPAAVVTPTSGAASGSGATPKPSATSSTSHASASGTSSGASRTLSTDNWERAVITVGSAVILSIIGGLLVL